MNNKEAEQILEWAKAVEACNPRVATDMRAYINQEYNPASVDEKLDRIIALLEKPDTLNEYLEKNKAGVLTVTPRILTQDPLDALGQLNENLVKRRPEQPDPATLSVLHPGVRLQTGDWAVECSNPGHFLKVHPDQFGKFADHPAYSYFRPKSEVRYSTPDKIVYREMEVAQLPPYPPVPEGYSHWEDRGCGWESEGEVMYSCLHVDYLGDGWTPASKELASGVSVIRYIEAIKK